MHANASPSASSSLVGLPLNLHLLRLSTLQPSLQTPPPPVPVLHIPRIEEPAAHSSIWRGKRLGNVFTDGSHLPGNAKCYQCSNKITLNYKSSSSVAVQQWFSLPSYLMERWESLKQSDCSYRNCREGERVSTRSKQQESILWQ